MAFPGEQVVLDSTGLILFEGRNSRFKVSYDLGESTSIYFSVAVLSLLGIVGNIISLIVWTRPRLKSSSAILLTALAASDLVTVLIIHSTATLGIIHDFVGHSSESANFFTGNFWKFNFIIIPHVEVWSLAVFNAAQTASTYLTLAITLERYIAVCRPFQFRTICTYSRAGKSAATIVVFSILFNLCRFWERELGEYDGMVKYGGCAAYYIIQTEMRKNLLYISVYRIWLYLIINYLLPLAGIVILNTTICLKLKMSNIRERQTLTNLQKNESRLTRMLLSVVVEFLVCTSVTGFIAIWNTFDAGRRITLFGYELSSSILTLSVFFNTFNSSVNFVTYVTFGEPFRTTFVEMFCCCCCKGSAHHMGPASPGQQNRTTDTSEDIPI